MTGMLSIDLNIKAKRIDFCDKQKGGSNYHNLVMSQVVKFYEFICIRIYSGRKIEFSKLYLMPLKYLKVLRIT